MDDGKGIIKDTNLRGKLFSNDSKAKEWDQRRLHLYQIDLLGCNPCSNHSTRGLRIHGELRVRRDSSRLLPLVAIEDLHVEILEDNSGIGPGGLVISMRWVKPLDHQKEGQMTRTPSMTAPPMAEWLALNTQRLGAKMKGD